MWGGLSIQNQLWVKCSHFIKRSLILYFLEQDDRVKGNGWLYSSSTFIHVQMKWVIMCVLAICNMFQKLQAYLFPLISWEHRNSENVNDFLKWLRNENAEYEFETGFIWFQTSYFLLLYTIDKGKMGSELGFKRHQETLL